MLLSPSFFVFLARVGRSFGCLDDVATSSSARNEHPSLSLYWRLRVPVRAAAVLCFFLFFRFSMSKEKNFMCTAAHFGYYTRRRNETCILYDGPAVTVNKFAALGWKCAPPSAAAVARLRVRWSAMANRRTSSNAIGQTPFATGTCASRRLNTSIPHPRDHHTRCTDARLRKKEG